MVQTHRASWRSSGSPRTSAKRSALGGWGVSRGRLAVAVDHHNGFVVALFAGNGDDVAVREKQLENLVLI